jgi:putative sugar O-methyltransferase
MLKTAEFMTDSNYDFDLVKRCYVDNRKMLDDVDIIKRIVKAYKKAKTVQKNAPGFYQVSNEWLPIYKKHLKTVMKALEDEDIPALQTIYQNFWRDPCSTGLLGFSAHMKKQYFGRRIQRKHKKLHLFSGLHRIKLWRSLMGPNASLPDLSSPAIGNPFYCFIDGQMIKSGSDYLHYYASSIGRLTNFGKKRVVVEIGGGYGGMAYYLLRDQSNLTYVDFDLPENMALTAYYLLNAFPEKKAVLYGEAELTPDCIAKNDLVIMPNFELEKMGSNSVDLVFNSYSLAEMSPETIAQYIAMVSRITKKYFLHVNHTVYSLVTADEFGIDPKQFTLIYKLPALWNAGINPDMDEYEYLYEKRDTQS